MRRSHSRLWQGRIQGIARVRGIRRRGSSRQARATSAACESVFPNEHFFDHTHPDIESAVRAALDSLAAMGASVVPVDLPHAADAALARTLHLAEAASYRERRLSESPSLLGTELRERLERARSYTAVDYVKALRLRTVLTEEAARAFDACDVIAAPTDRNLPAAPCAIGIRRDSAGAPRHSAARTHFSPA